MVKVNSTVARASPSFQSAVAGHDVAVRPFGRGRFGRAIDQISTVANADGWSLLSG